MATRATLSGLPLELFESVAQHLPKSSLLSLRSVSRDCNTKTHYTFISAYFAEINILALHNPSVESAICIAQEEKYGKEVRTLVIDIRELVWPVHYYVVKGEKLSKTNPSYERNDSIMHPKTAALLHKYEEMSSYKTRLISLLQRYLTVLLILFKQYGKLRKIKVVDYDTGTRPCGTKNIWGDDLPDYDHINTMSVMKYLLPAMSASHTDLDLFSIQCEGWAIPGNIVFDSAYFINDATDAFKDIKNLNLSFWNELTFWDDRPFSIDDAQCLLRILPTFLEKLHIRIHNPCNHYGVGDCEAYCAKWEKQLILESLFLRTFPRLRRLSIHGGEIRPRALRDFFSRHEMLEELTFEGAMIIGMGFRVDNGDPGVASLWRDLEGTGICVKDDEAGTVSGHVKHWY